MDPAAIVCNVPEWIKQLHFNFTNSESRFDSGWYLWLLSLFPLLFLAPDVRFSLDWVDDWAIKYRLTALWPFCVDAGGQRGQALLTMSSCASWRRRRRRCCHSNRSKLMLRRCLLSVSSARRLSLSPPRQRSQRPCCWCHEWPVGALGFRIVLRPGCFVVCWIVEFEFPNVEFEVVLAKFSCC